MNKQIERENKASFRSASPVPAIPANSFQLESDFRKLKDCPEKMYLYLKVGTVVLSDSFFNVEATVQTEVKWVATLDCLNGVQ